MSIDKFNGVGFLVAGGAQGIGLDVALTASHRGATVVVSVPLDSDTSQLMRTVQSARLEGRVSFVPTDLTGEEHVDTLVDVALDRMPSLNVLVSAITNPLSSQSKHLPDMSLAEWDAVVGSNLRTTFLLCRRAIEEFLAVGEGGRIVLVTPAASDGTLGSVGPAALRTALFSLTRSISKEYGRHEIACNLVTIPAHLSSPDAAWSTSSPQHLHPNGGAQEYEKVTEVVLFLASREASFVNGEELFVTEGASRGYPKQDD